MYCLCIFYRVYNALQFKKVHFPQAEQKNLNNLSYLTHEVWFVFKVYLKYKIKFNLNYNRILNWSIKNPGNFWDSIWDFCKVKGTKGNIKIIKSKTFFGSSLFVDIVNIIINTGIK